jgi:hypothetical protein
MTLSAIHRNTCRLETCSRLAQSFGVMKSKPAVAVGIVADDFFAIADLRFEIASAQSLNGETDKSFSLVFPRDSTIEKNNFVSTRGGRLTM